MQRSPMRSLHSAFLFRDPERCRIFQAVQRGWECKISVHWGPRGQAWFQCSCAASLGSINGFSDNMCSIIIITEVQTSHPECGTIKIIDLGYRSQKTEVACTFSKHFGLDGMKAHHFLLDFRTFAVCENFPWSVHQTAAGGEIRKAVPEPPWLRPLEGEQTSLPFAGEADQHWPLPGTWNKY